MTPAFSRFVTVYCASSSKAQPAFVEMAQSLGRALTAASYGIICGAGNSGLMAALADAALAEGGFVKGIIPRFMQKEGWMHHALSDYKITETMHERKEAMIRQTEAVIALPGGCGTLEELMEAITWKQLGLFSGSIIILNINGFYDALLAMLQRCVSESLMRKEHTALWHVVSSAEEVVEVLRTGIPTSPTIRKIAAI